MAEYTTYHYNNGYLQYIQNYHHDQISKISIIDLVEKYRTPFYLYDLNKLQYNIEILRKAFQNCNAVFSYAQKSNSNKNVLNIIKNNGFHIDAVSKGELYRAIQLGFPHDTITYVTDVFDKEALEICVKNNIYVSLGSLDLIKSYASLLSTTLSNPSNHIMIRINTGFGAGHHKKVTTGGIWSKHGIWHSQIPEALEIAKKHNIVINGLHVHIGSQVDFNCYEKLCHWFCDNASQFVDLEKLNFGGGFPVVYRPGDKYNLINENSQLFKQTIDYLSIFFQRPLQLIIEPGRFLTAEFGLLFSTIQSIKKQDSILFYLINAGFSQLARPSFYGSYHHFSIYHHDQNQDDNISSTQPVSNIESCEQKKSLSSPNSSLNLDITMVDAIVAGPLCESGDIFNDYDEDGYKLRKLPQASLFDTLIIHDTGAYGFTMSSNYNSIPLAPEIVLENGLTRISRPGQTLTEMTSLP